MNVVWPQAILYEPPKVLGKTLRGFSAFHALMLEAVQSPFLVGGKTDLQDLILAVHVCAHGWADRATIKDTEAIKAWGEHIKSVDFVDAQKQFSNYLTESFAMPEFWNNSGSTLRANFAFHLVTFGMRILGLSEADAWDTPIARMVCYRACWAESEGDTSLKSDDEQAGLDLLRKENGQS